jgi:hypothetical protein
VFVVRNVFRAKPGKAKELVAIFKQAQPLLAEIGIPETRLMTDAVAGFWTVVVESHVADMGDYVRSVEAMGKHAGIQAAMKGYMELVEGGHREIFRVE